MSKNWVRIKQEGMEVIAFSLDLLESYELRYDNIDDIYYVTVDLPQGSLQITSGTFDECHSLLNKLNKLQKINILDL